MSGPEPLHKKTIIIFDLHSLSATIFGSSPWQRYSSHNDADPQSFLSRRMSSVKVEPGAPMNTLDMAHIVLSNIASTFSVKIFIMNISNIN
ncbi:O-fucosyltransferase family protein [Trifolium repens]|nr:O-fucosyltransferase family protein [Trifolium repens]